MRAGTRTWLAALGVLAVIVVGAAACTPADVRTPNYGGYRTAAGTNKNVTATFKVVAVTCGSGQSGASMQVNHVRSNSYVNSAAFLYFCSGGSLTYYAEAKANGAGSAVVKPASVGNTITVSVTVTGSTVRSTIKNVTRNWTVTNSGPVGAVDLIQVGTNTVVAGGAEVPLANFSSEAFTAVNVGGQPLGQSNPTRLIMTGANNVVRVQPSAISGGNSFTNTWKHA